MARVRCLRWSAIVLAVLLAGCNVNTRIDVTLRPDGTGTLRSTVTLDADAVQQLGGPASLDRTVPLGDLRKAGWIVSKWTRGVAGSEAVSLVHTFSGESELERRVVDLAGPHGILQSPALTRDRGWFSSHDGLAVVVDVRSPRVDIVHDAPLAARLRAAGTDPAKVEAQLAVQLRTALHVSVMLHLPDGSTKSYDAPAGSVHTVTASSGGLAWDHVVKFGIGVALALLALMFVLAAAVGARRNRRRAAERVDTGVHHERAPLM